MFYSLFQNNKIINDTSCHFLSLATSLKAGLYCKCNQQHRIRRNKELLIELKSKTGYFRIEVAYCAKIRKM